MSRSLSALKLQNISDDRLREFVPGSIFQNNLVIFRHRNLVWPEFTRRVIGIYPGCSKRVCVYFHDDLGGCPSRLTIGRIPFGPLQKRRSGDVRQWVSVAVELLN